MKTISYKDLDILIAICNDLVSKNEVSKNVMRRLQIILMDNIAKIPSPTNSNEIEECKLIASSFVICNKKMREYTN